MSDENNNYMGQDSRPNLPPAAAECTCVDWFLADLGGIQVPLTEELRAAMLAHAREFLAAGGRVEWARWALLGPASRAAFREAVEEMKIRAVLSE